MAGLEVLRKQTKNKLGERMKDEYYYAQILIFLLFSNHIGIIYACVIFHKLYIIYNIKM